MKRRALITLLVLILLGGGAAALCLRTVEASGGNKLYYPQKGPAPTKAELEADTAALTQYITERGFQPVAATDIPPEIRKVPDYAHLIASFEHPMPLSRPISLRLYRSDSPGRFWIAIYRKSPLWAAGISRDLMEEFRAPLTELWHVKKRQHHAPPAGQ